jgi:hypothetical protein
MLIRDRVAIKNFLVGAVAASLLMLPLQASASQTQPPPANGARPDSGRIDQRYRFRVLGVYDSESGEPIEGAEVRDVLSGTSALTTTTGTVSLMFLPDGGSLVRIRKIGYTAQTLVVAIDPSTTVPATIVLEHAPQQLPKVTVLDSSPTYRPGNLREATERIKAHAGGSFISETEMRNWDSSTMSDLITSHMPGLIMNPGPHGEAYLLSTRGMCVMALSCVKSNCYVTVFIDGIKAYDANIGLSSSRLNFDRLSPQDYAIAEFYPGIAGRPPEYNGPCGVLLLWSRDR